MTLLNTVPWTKKTAGYLSFRLLLSAAALLLAGSTAPAETLEHAIISPLPGSVLVEDLSYIKELGAFQFPVTSGPGKTEFRMVQGRKWFLAYMSPKREPGKTPYSRSEIIAYFKSLNDRLGGRVLYEDEGRLYFVFYPPGGITCWVYVWTSELGYYNLHIVEEAAAAGGDAASREQTRAGGSPEKPVLSELRALFKAAEDAYVSGEKFSAMDALKKAMSVMSRELPLTARNVRLVTDTTHYKTRQNNIYKAGEPILISCQLTGYGFKREAGNYTIDITTDFLVLAEDGKILGSQEGAYTFSHTSPSPTPEFPMDLTYVLSDAPRGTYTIHTVIKDQNSDKQTKFINEIVIR
jgi:hypothetical protein